MTEGFPLLTDDDLYLFNEGNHTRLHEKLGAHLATVNREDGCAFGVWAPSARSVSVIGDFNEWDPERTALAPRGSSGIWEAFVPGVALGARYKYRVVSRFHGYQADKADPFAVRCETPPQTGSVVWNLDYEWGDQAWMQERGRGNALEAPISIYEVHVGSWRRAGEHGEHFLSYRDFAHALADYVERTGFTHVELLPVMEHPFFGSWGYQVTGFFAPSGRYGTPQDFMYLVDHLHQRGIGVILDWVPSHFPDDPHGLSFFDGTYLFEHADPRQGYHPDWHSLIFNYGRHEVRSFLLSSAMHWLTTYHADGLRVDAVASMLHLDYSRGEGEWIPNEYGGRENLGAIEFLRRLNQTVYGTHPDVQTYAEESTSWPMVSRPVYVGGLGFGLKWDMGWMNDTLEYMSMDPVYRRFHHTNLTFRQLYSATENFLVPLSHDEVVHGKRSLAGRMPGDDDLKLAGLRLLLAYQWAQNGKKLLFMGGEFGQWREWNHDQSLDWHLLHDPRHLGVLRVVEDLNRRYRDEPALHELDVHPGGFEWIDANDTEASVVSFLRRGRSTDDIILVLCNFTPLMRENYLVGVPRDGTWHEILNTDAAEYGGGGRGNLGGVEAVPVSAHGRPYAVTAILPPMACLYFKSDGPGT